MLDKDVLTTANDKKFSEFSKAVKQELHNKLANHKVTKQYVSDFDKIQQMKKSFAEISKSQTSEEPKEPEEPKKQEEPEE